ncbi:hypothetical protein SSX86_019850 [Deinandra increscens subsp. villosa]|uniref:Transmembrane protein n=1 Tax=Deinandra increscens subsp. villosa TaxID=3103831 RepID=A0AAP0CV21_9ASTR
MAFKISACTLLVFLVILIAVMSPTTVEGRRALSTNDFAKANHLAAYSTVYEKAKSGMSFWLQRLASGPSPRGPGH